MGYYSDFSGEVVITGLFLSDLTKYCITTENQGQELSVVCNRFSTGFYLENPEPSGFRVDEKPPTILIYSGDESESGHGFSDLVNAVYSMWREGHVESAQLRRCGESGDDTEHYFLSDGKWKTIKTTERIVIWKPKP